MPYITQEPRKQLDEHIDKLAQAIVDESNKLEGDTAYAGLLNYTCTRLALKIIKIKFGKIRYWIVAITTGVFKNVADEFYRRLATPYEDLQIKKNGDVDLYEEFNSQMK